MAGWTTINQKLNPGGLNLMQNCDLPPPLKIFARSDKTDLTSMKRVWTIMGQEDGKINIQISTDGSENEKLELLNAVRLSQTRAREAERKAARFTRERDTICAALVKESSHLFGYRQMVKLLEFQVSKLQEDDCNDKSRKNIKLAREDDSTGAGNLTWFMTFALCLGIAGVGFALGCGYFL